MYVRIAGQMGGGLIAFPMFHALSNYLKLEPFGGPEYNMDKDHESNAVAFLSEFEATFLLVLVVYAVNLQINFGSYHYWIKQSLTAIAIRALIEVRLSFINTFYQLHICSLQSFSPLHWNQHTCAYIVLSHCRSGDESNACDRLGCIRRYGKI